MKSKNILGILSLAAFLAAGDARAAMEIAPPPPPPIKIGGFLQSWLVAGNSTSAGVVGKQYRLSGDLLRHFRVRFQADPIPGVSVIMIPELTAGAFTLLDGYATLDAQQVFLGETTPGELSFTVGQFKTPFGLNRMYAPPQLTSAEYSTVSGRTFGSTSFWDAGLMATYKGKLFRLDVATVKGLGPNQFGPAPNVFTLSTNQDYCARLEVPLMDGQLVVGGSYYYGKHFVAPGTQGFLIPRHWFGAFFKLKGLPKTYEIETEFISRNTEGFYVGERLGVSALASFWLTGNLQPFVLYEFVEDRPAYASSTGRMGGGINWFPVMGGPVRLTLEMIGESFGLHAASPSWLSNGKTVLQTQVIF